MPRSLLTRAKYGASRAFDARTDADLSCDLDEASFVRKERTLLGDARRRYRDSGDLKANDTTCTPRTRETALLVDGFAWHPARE